MRLQLVLAILLSMPLAAAGSYTIYSLDGGNISPSANVTFVVTPFPGDVRDGIDGFVSAVQDARETNDTDLIKDAEDALRGAIANAKLSDRVLISSPWKNLLLNYQECAETGPYHFCFDEVKYPEEDGPPLGGKTYSQVRFVHGDFNLPFTITMTEAKTSMTASRHLNATKIFLDDSVTVTLLATNTGDAPIDGATIIDTPPFTITGGEVRAFRGALLSGDSITTSYTVTPPATGTYAFTGTIKPNLVNFSDSTLTVIDAQDLAIASTDVIAGQSGNVTVVITNYYTGPVTVGSFSLSSNEKITKVIDAPATPHIGSSGLTISPFTVAANKNATFIITYSTITSGEARFSATANTNAPTSHTRTATTTSVVEEQGARLATVINNRTATITLTNTADKPLTNVHVAWGDRLDIQDTIPTLATTDTRSYTYETPGTYTVSVSYTMGRLQRTRTVKVIVTGNATVSTPSTPVAEPAQPTTQPAAPAVVPAAPATSTTPEKAPEKGLITRFLDWLQSFFD